MKDSKVNRTGDYLKINSIRKLLFELLKLLLYALLLFGTGFSKFQLIGPLYLHDFFLVILVVTALLFYKIPITQKKILLLFIISIIYLLISISKGNPVFFILRQYIIFFYMISGYIVFQVTKKYSIGLIKMLKNLSKVAVTVQLFYTLYILFVLKESVFIGYSYFSPLVIMLFPVFLGDRLSRNTGVLNKALTFFVILLFSATLGHASIFLAILVVGFVYILFLITRKQLLILISILLGVLIILALTLPQFKDANASWRLIYWWMGIQGGTNNFLLGNGFGVPYINQEQIDYFIETFNNSNDFLKDPSEVYFIAYHNSFITIFYHVGIFVFLLAKPYLLIINRIKNKDYSNNQLFLILSLLGVTVWSCFNVILELPHSAILFWLIYFTATESLMFRNEKR